MATKTSQRVFIWFIAIILTIGTIGTYAALVLGNQNNSADTDQMQQMAKQIKTEAYANNQPLKGYKASKFDPSSVDDKLVKKDLKVGTGPAAKPGDKLTVDYFGWTPDGKIFDSTNKKDGSGKAYSFTPKTAEVITGWKQGIPGMKVGGVRKLVIPSSLAYGASGSLVNPYIPGVYMIKPNTPIAFIVRLDKIQ